MSAMLGKVIEYPRNVDEVLSGCSVEEASLGISSSSWAEGHPIRKRERDRMWEGGCGMRTDRKGSD